MFAFKIRLLTTILVLNLLIAVTALAPYFLASRALLGGVRLGVLFGRCLSCFPLSLAFGATGTATTLHLFN